MGTVTSLSWDMQDPEGAYDPNKRYTQSTDKKGHSAWLKLRVPTQIGAEIARIVQSGKIPEYGSAQDLARDAVVHHLHAINQYLEDEQLDRVLTLTMLYDDATRRENDRKMFNDYIEVLKDNFRYLIERKQYRTVRAQVAELQESIDAIPPEAQDEFLEFLNTQLALTRK